MQKHDHYCKICGEYKANEKFSGKGHAAHICKKCAALPFDERNEAETITRIENLPFYLSKEQIAWLQKKQNDKRPEVAALAKEAFAMRFPYAERNARKKQLHIMGFEFSVNGELYNDDLFIPEAMSFTADSTKNTIEMRCDKEQKVITLTQKDMVALLRYAINELEIFCWQEDYLRQDDYIDNDDFDDELDDDICDGKPENNTKDAETQFVWKVDVDYKEEGRQSIISYEDSIPDKVNDLAVKLYSYFSDEDDADDIDDSIDE